MYAKIFDDFFIVLHTFFEEGKKDSRSFTIMLISFSLYYEGQT